jgi:urease accessory protein
MKDLVRGTLVACLLMLTSPAWAHAPIMGIGGVLGGALHALLIPEHGMSLVALGVFLGRQQTVARRQEALSFMAALAAGLILIALIGEAALAADFLLLATAILGLLIAANWGPPLLGWPLAVVIGGALALDSPPEVSSTGEAIRMLIGSGLGAAVAVALLAEAAGWFRGSGPLIAMRVLGSWIAAIAILVLALRIATRVATG